MTDEARALEDGWTIYSRSWPLYRLLWRFHGISLEFGGWARLRRLQRTGEARLVGVRDRFNGELRLVDVQGKTVLMVFNHYGPHDVLPERFTTACTREGKLPTGWSSPVGQEAAAVEEDRG